MKLNLLSVRQAHFLRLGIIDEKDVSDFITTQSENMALQCFLIWMKLPI